MIERPYHPDEVKVLKRGAPPQFGKTGSGDIFGCFILFLIVPLFGVTGYIAQLYVSLFWATVIPLGIFIVLFFAWHYLEHTLMTRRYGHAVVETMKPDDIQIDCDGNIYTVTVSYGNGASVSWTGPTALMLYNAPESAFRESLALYAVGEGGQTIYKDVPLEAIFWKQHLARRWIQFEVNKATARFWLEDWSLEDYLRTEYNLVRSSKSGELLFIRLTSGETTAGLKVTFKDADIRYIMPGEG